MDDNDQGSMIAGLITSLLLMLVLGLFYWKKKLISKAIRDHALCIFNHDTQVKAAYLSGETNCTER